MRLFRLMAILFCLLSADTGIAGDMRNVGLNGTFEQRIEAIKTKLDDWERGSILGFELLLVMPEFQALASESDTHIDECLAFLANPAHDRHKRTIAEYSMHKLSLDHWVYFVNRTIDLFDAHRIEIRDVMDVVSPMHGFQHNLMDNFMNPKVRAIAYRVKALPAIEPFERQAMTDILLGITPFFKWLFGPEVYR